MKIQPMLKLAGIRIELSMPEAEKIAGDPASGGNRIQKEIATLVELHQSGDGGQLLPSSGPDPHQRLDGSHPSKEKKSKRKPYEPSPRVACEYCGGLYAQRGMTMHLRRCEARLKVEERERDQVSIVDPAFDPNSDGAQT